MASKGRLLVLGALSFIGMFCFRADEQGRTMVAPTTETPHLRNSFKDHEVHRRIHEFERSLSEEPVQHVATEHVAVENVAIEHVATEHVATENVATENVAIENVATEHVHESNIADDIDTNPADDVATNPMDDLTVDVPRFEEIHVTLRILMNSTFNPYAQIVKHTDCLAECERRIFDAYIR